MMRSRILAASVTLLVGTSALAQPSGSAPAMPALVKNSCAACHSFTQGGPNGQGPNLYGIVGKKAGSAAGFGYSPAFQKALGGKVWTRELMDAWLADTQKVAPGNQMTFFLDEQKYRAQIVDYFAGKSGK
jgi:cytochrome c